MLRSIGAIALLFLASEPSAEPPLPSTPINVRVANTPLPVRTPDTHWLVTVDAIQMHTPQGQTIEGGTAVVTSTRPGILEQVSVFCDNAPTSMPLTALDVFMKTPPVPAGLTPVGTAAGPPGFTSVYFKEPFFTVSGTLATPPLVVNVPFVADFGVAFHSDGQAETAVALRCSVTFVGRFTD